MDNRHSSPFGVGIITIITVLLVLTLSIFAALTFSTARADLALSEINAQTVQNYYAADALAVESTDGEAAQAYVNVLAVKEGRENDPAIQALVAALQSDEVKAFMEETWPGAVVPMF